MKIRPVSVKSVVCSWRIFAPLRALRGISSPVAAIPGLYYLSTIEGVLKTTDSGATLQAAGNVDGGRVNAITHDRDTPSAAYLAAT